MATVTQTSEEALDLILAMVGEELRRSGNKKCQTSLNDLSLRAKVNESVSVVNGIKLGQDRRLLGFIPTRPDEPYSFPFAITLSPEGQARADRLNQGTLSPGASIDRYAEVQLTGTRPVPADVQRLARDGDTVIGIGTTGDAFLLVRIAGRLHATQLDLVV